MAKDGVENFLNVIQDIANLLLRVLKSIPSYKFLCQGS